VPVAFTSPQHLRHPTAVDGEIDRIVGAGLDRVALLER